MFTVAKKRKLATERQATSISGENGGRDQPPLRHSVILGVPIEGSGRVVFRNFTDAQVERSNQANLFRKGDAFDEKCTCFKVVRKSILSNVSCTLYTPASCSREKYEQIFPPFPFLSFSTRKSSFVTFIRHLHCQCREIYVGRNIEVKINVHRVFYL